MRPLDKRHVSAGLFPASTREGRTFKMTRAHGWTVERKRHGTLLPLPKVDPCPRKSWANLLNTSGTRRSREGSLASLAVVLQVPAHTLVQALNGNAAAFTTSSASADWSFVSEFSVPDVGICRFLLLNTPAVSYPQTYLQPNEQRIRLPAQHSIKLMACLEMICATAGFCYQTLTDQSHSVMTSNGSESYVQKLQHYCATNQIAQPQFQDYSDPRGVRTAWSSSVFVHGREYRAHLWRDYRYLEQSREEAAEVAWKAISGASGSPTSQPQYAYPRSYTTAR
ncbi:uncharacterized protein EKO05_0008431 [Ascochyta rabiei]|uniref:uncharacterized protein n=1 Tax=Didymella rabiei TaxID=5454 RepID=UPI002207D203|nr:uncharacterized protein EKO05_0008431 [Ascochyta rabiei]UPX18115.1 hypothetical protein EKO05_0008431 [Ascochyta rabiei]